MGDLSKDFSRSEFVCLDGCGADAVSPVLVSKLQAMRDDLGQYLVITSGVRCTTQNAKVGGKPDSAHLNGHAADISAMDSRLRMEIVKAAVHAGISRIGIGKNFVHVDVDESKPQNVMWLYA